MKEIKQKMAVASGHRPQIHVEFSTSGRLRPRGLSKNGGFFTSMNSMPLVPPKGYTEMCECASEPKESEARHKLPKFTKELLSILVPYYYLQYHFIPYHTYYGTKVPKLVPFRTEESTILLSGSTS